MSINIMHKKYTLLPNGSFNDFITQLNLYIMIFKNVNLRLHQIQTYVPYFDCYRLTIDKFEIDRKILLFNA